MRLYQVALREVLRRKIRTMYTASGVVLSVALMVATVVVGVSGRKEIQLTIARYGHSLTIFPATTTETSLRGFGIGSGHYIPEKMIPNISEVYEAAIRAGWEKMGRQLFLGAGTPGGIDDFEQATFAPRLYEETTIDGRKVVVAGVDPEAEYKIRFWWDVEDGQLVRKPDEVMLGRVYATSTNTKVGRVLAINGRAFKVAGILKDTDSPDDYMVFGLMKPIQGLFGRDGQVSMINVRAMCNYCPVGEAELEINKTVVGVRATSQREVARAQHAIFENVSNIVLGFVVLTLFIACMAMFNMTMGTIHGRIREIGLLKVLGASPVQLIRLFMYEAAVIGLAGGAVGFLFGLAISRIVGPWLLPGVEIELAWWYVPLAVVIAVLSSVLATCYPAWFASRVRAAEAFRAL